MKPYWRAAAWYLAFGVFWIFASDQWLDSMADGTAVLTAMQTMKGWMFICLSAALVFVLTKRTSDQRAALEAEKLAVFRKTVEGAHHILINYVNQMQIVTLTAESYPGFDRETLQVAEEISEKVVSELKKLDRIPRVTSDEIDAVIYEDLRKRSLAGKCCRRSADHGALVFQQGAGASKGLPGGAGASLVAAHFFL